MDYVKKVMMLRRVETTTVSAKPLSVLARVEIESGVGEFYISVVNLPTFNKKTNYYALVIDSKGKDFEFDLGSRPTSNVKNFYEAPSVIDGVAIGLYCTSEQIPITLAFASQGCGICLQEFKKIVADKCLLRFKQNIKEQECKCQKENSECENLGQKNLSDKILTQYNDEAVATENYYELEDEIKLKIKTIKEKKSENLFFENELAYNSSKKTEEEELPFTYGAQDEANACECQKNKNIKENELKQSLDCENDNYYDGVKNELEQIFYSYSREEGLEKVFSESKWAKIFYTKDKYYVVGLIFEQAKEKYICYGVPSRYSKTPPTGLEGCSSFIPLSIFDMFGDGYFIMFQDAKTGKCVHLN